MDKPDNPSKRFIVKMAKDIFESDKKMADDHAFHELSSIDPSRITSIEKRNSDNLVVAILFADFYDSFHQNDGGGANHNEKALDMMVKTDLIPLRDELAITYSQRPEKRHEIIKPFQERTMGIDSSLQQFMGNICVAVMQILSLQFQACRQRQQQREAQMISRKCDIIYAYFNRMESTIKPAGAGDDTAQNISKYYYRTRLH